jgi:hypothetical protein
MCEHVLGIMFKEDEWRIMCQLVRAFNSRSRRRGEKVFQHKNSFESIITVDTFLKRICERVKEEIYFLSVLEMGISPRYTHFLLTDDASLHRALYISMLMWIPLVIQTMSGNFWGRKILMVSKSLYSCWILGRKKCGKN